MRRKIFVSVALLFAPSLVSAQTTPPAVETTVPAPVDPLAKENWPLNMVDRPLGLSAGMLQVDVNAGASLSKNLAGKPVTLPLSVWFGVASQLQIGLTHVGGLCITGESNGCGKVYDDVGVNALYSITGRGSNFELAGWAQVNYSSFDKGTMNLQVGPAINWVIAGNAALLAYPGVQIGLNKRDEQGNKEVFGAPVYLYFRATPNIAPVLYTGIAGALDGFSNSYRVPVGLGALVGLSPLLDVGARFDFPNLLGKHASGVGAADERALLAWVSVRPL